MSAAPLSCFARVMGQNRAKAFLENLLRTARIPSALLFHGPSGVGKKLLAVEFAKALFCPQGGNPCGSCFDCRSIEKGIQTDVKLVNAAYQASFLNEDISKQKSLRVKTIRHLRRDMELQSLLGSWKVAIIDEAHTLEPEAANALLKIIEEPPPATLWILITAHRERVLGTIRSRSVPVLFKPLPTSAVSEILAGKGISPDRAELLARAGEGSVDLSLALEDSLDSARSFFSDPLAAPAVVESFPKELALQRVKVEQHIDALSQELRARHLENRLNFSQVEAPLRDLLELRQALSRNVDPKLILILAGEAARKT